MTATPRPPWRHTFIALSVRNYRIYATSNLVSSTAGQMSRIAQDWLVLELSGSVAAIGVTVALQFAPMLLFGLWGGLLADRLPKRRLLMVTQSIAAVSMLALAIVTLVGAVEVWHIFALALIQGFVLVVDNPTRLAFAGELAGPDLLRNAISLGTTTFQLGALIGPAVAGVFLVTAGAGWCFAISAAACAFVVVSMARVRVRELFASAVIPRSRGQLRQGLRHVIQEPAILWTLITLAFLAVFGQTLSITLAAFADDVYEVGAAGYGLFNTFVAVGALVGGILSTRRRGVTLGTVLVAAAGYSVAQVLGSAMPAEWSFVVLLAATGLLWMLFSTAANALVQFSSPTGIRGRVLSVYVLVMLGGQAIGGPLSGAIVDAVGARAGMAVAGLVPALATAAVAVIGWRQGLLRRRG